MPSREDLRMDRHVLNVRPRDVLPNKMFFKLPSIHLTVTFILTVTFFFQKAYIYYTLSNLQAAEFLVWDWVILPSAYITYIWISSLPNYQWHIPCPSIPQFLNSSHPLQFCRPSSPSDRVITPSIVSYYYLGKTCYTNVWIHTLLK